MGKSIKQGLAQGLEQGKLEMLVQLLEQSLLTKEQAAQAINMKLEVFEQYIKRMKEKDI